MIKSLRLVRYKGFEDCRIPLHGNSVLVGANNAGKSTAIHAIRLVAALVPQAKRVQATYSASFGQDRVRGWPIAQAAFDAASFTTEAVRHEFGEDEARIELEFDNKAKIIVVWPERDNYDDTDFPFYFIVPPENFHGDPRTAARTLIPEIGVVPTLSPLDDHEQQISETVLRRNLTSRRTSRSFRNAMWRVSLDAQEWSDLREFVFSNTPEIVDMALAVRTGDQGVELDFYYVEPGSRKEREFVWAGDGLQIWIQILFHIWRNRESSVLVLDEPDVFLHPDLQRRLARIVLSLGKQVIMATHSVEVLAETEPGTAVWVDRGRRRGERLKMSGSLAFIGRRLGSGLELSLARALRSRLALFVEGDDMPIIKAIAGGLGARRVEMSDGFSVIPLGGFSRNHVAGAFAEVLEALGGDVQVFVALDRDLRCDHVVALTEATLRAQGAAVYLWEQREIENYLLDPYAISGVTSLRLDVAEELLDASVAALKEEARLSLQTARLEEAKMSGSPTSKLADKSVLQYANAEFERLWADPKARLATVDAKAVIRSMNESLRSKKVRSITSLRLAKEMPADGVGTDLRRFVEDLETHLASS